MRREEAVQSIGNPVFPERGFEQQALAALVDILVDNVPIDPRLAAESLARDLPDLERFLGDINGYGETRTSIVFSTPIPLRGLARPEAG